MDEYGDFIGDINYLGAAYEGSNITIDPSLAQIRHCLTEYFVLPQGWSGHWEVVESSRMVYIEVQ